MFFNQSWKSLGYLFQIGIGIAYAKSLQNAGIINIFKVSYPYSALTIKTPMIMKAKALFRVCVQIVLAESPLSNLALKANGTDIPTINKNAGKTRSTKVIASASAGMCFIHCGTFFTLANSFTKIITKIVIPRKASIEIIL